MAKLLFGLGSTGIAFWRIGGRSP